MVDSRVSEEVHGKLLSVPRGWRPGNGRRLRRGDVVSSSCEFGYEELLGILTNSATRCGPSRGDPPLSPSVKREGQKGPPLPSRAPQPPMRRTAFMRSTRPSPGACSWAEHSKGRASESKCERGVEPLRPEVRGPGCALHLLSGPDDAAAIQE